MRCACESLLLKPPFLVLLPAISTNEEDLLGAWHSTTTNIIHNITCIKCIHVQAISRRPWRSFALNGKLNNASTSWKIVHAKRKTMNSLIYHLNIYPFQLYFMVYRYKYTICSQNSWHSYFLVFLFFFSSLVSIVWDRETYIILIIWCFRCSKLHIDYWLYTKF